MAVHLGQSEGVALRCSAQGLRIVQDRQWSSQACGRTAHLGQTGFCLLVLTRPFLDGVAGALGAGVGGGRDAIGRTGDGCTVGDEMALRVGGCVGGRRGKWTEGPGTGSGSTLNPGAGCGDHSSGASSGSTCCGRLTSGETQDGTSSLRCGNRSPLSSGRGRAAGAAGGGAGATGGSGISSSPKRGAPAQLPISRLSGSSSSPKM